jgi:hypothetical protein
MTSYVDDRKVWVVVMPEGVVVDPGAEVMIEQFGDQPPSIAFRDDRRAVWGRPFPSESR